MTYQSEKLDPLLRGREIGVFVTRGGYIPVGSDLLDNEVFIVIHVGIGGDLIVKGVDGLPNPYFKVTAGSQIAVMGKGIMASAEIDGYGTLTTNADQISWHGGNGIVDR